MSPEPPDPPPTSGGAGTASLFAGVGDICERAARYAVADGAALAVVTRHAHTRELVYATDLTAARLDELQYTLGEGPCLDAYLDDEAQFHPDLDSMTRTSRWPTFATETTQLGVHSLFAFPVPGWRRPSGPSGVLELYRRTAGDLTDDQHAGAQACAAAIARQLETNWDDHLTRFGSLDEAIDASASAAQDGRNEPFTRTQINIAAGMLAVQLDIDPDEAVDRLRAHSYACGRRISSVAADVIARRLTLQAMPD